MKVQYPGADEALRSDLRQLSRISRLMQPLVPGLEIKPLIAELRDRMEEELDYRDEADEPARVRRRRSTATRRSTVPRVVASAPRALVTEWVGRPEAVGRHPRRARQDERDSAAALLAEFHYSSPARVGLLHADPHPGNFQLLARRPAVVIDFGAVARLPGRSAAAADA